MNRLDSKLNVVELCNVSILEQLKLEEALLRTSDENYLILNTGSPPAIVMGISGKAEDLIDLPKVKNIPIIKRFSGGGTVVIDEETLFVTFIFNRNVHPFEPFSNPILQWSASLYSKVIPNLTLQAQDYTIGDLKIGGNAQYIKKNRWLHHTSFLWDYNPDLMKLLLVPKKQPDYRKNRDHTSFITTLPLPTKESLFTHLKNLLSEQFTLESMTHFPPFPPHRKSTSTINP